MKKKIIHHKHHKTASVRRTKGEDYLVIVKGWMVVVAFALMLGLGAILGTFVNGQIYQTTPEVAGYSTDR